MACSGRLFSLLLNVSRDFSTSLLFPVILANVFEFYTSRAGRLAVTPGSHPMAVIAGPTDSSFDRRGAPPFDFGQVDWCNGRRLHGERGVESQGGCATWGCSRSGTNCPVRLQRRQGEQDVLGEESVDGEIWGWSTGHALLLGSICGPPNRALVPRNTSAFRDPRSHPGPTSAIGWLANSMRLGGSRSEIS